MQFIVKGCHAVVVVDIFVPEMLRCEICVELFDCFALENGFEIDVMPTFIQYLILGQGLDESTS